MALHIFVCILYCICYWAHVDGVIRGPLLTTLGAFIWQVITTVDLGLCSSVAIEHFHFLANRGENLGMEKSEWKRDGENLDL